MLLMFGLGSEYYLEHNNWYFKRHSWYKNTLESELTVISAGRCKNFIKSNEKIVGGVKYINVSSKYLIISICYSLYFLIKKRRSAKTIYFQDITIFFAHILICKIFWSNMLRIGGIHYDPISLGYFRKIFFNFSVSKCDKIRVITKSTKKYLENLPQVNLLLQKVVYYPTAVDPVFFKKSKKKRMSSFNRKFLSAICVARPSKSKGIFELIKFCEDRKQFTLTLISPKSLKESNFNYKALEDYVSKCNYVELIPSYLTSKKLSKLYNESDFYITMSYSEGLGKVYVEAAASCLPIFCRTNQGILSLNKKIKSLVLFDTVLSLNDKFNEFIENFDKFRKSASNQNDKLYAEFSQNKTGLRNAFTN